MEPGTLQGLNPSVGGLPEPRCSRCESLSSTTPLGQSRGQVGSWCRGEAEGSEWAVTLALRRSCLQEALIQGSGC